jgi:hypothetical protein
LSPLTCALGGRFIRHDGHRAARQADLSGDGRQAAAVRAPDLRHTVSESDVEHADEQRVWIVATLQWNEHDSSGQLTASHQGATG